MARSGVKPTTQRAEATRARIVQAAVETLKREGYAGASARAIAATGGFSQAAIFYHFRGIPDLLLAALDRTSAVRMERYRAAMDQVQGPSDLLAAAVLIFREDLQEGHMTVLAEMISAAVSLPELGPEIVKRIEPWIAFAQEAVGRWLRGSPLDALVPSHDAAFAAVAFYLGIELLSHLAHDSRSADSLFETAARLSSLFAPFLASPAVGAVVPPRKET